MSVPFEQDQIAVFRSLIWRLAVQIKAIERARESAGDRHRDALREGEQPRCKSMSLEYEPASEPLHISAK